LQRGLLRGLSKRGLSERELSERGLLERGLGGRCGLGAAPPG
jgi:hypothetical protein